MKLAVVVVAAILTLGGVFSHASGMSGIIAWGTSDESDFTWQEQLVSYTGVSIGCGFIGLGVGGWATPLAGFAAAELCSVGISA